MSYHYPTQKRWVCSEEGQPMFLRIRDRAKRLLDESGGVTTVGAVIKSERGDSWNMLACIDRLIELGELSEIANPVSAWGQHRILCRESDFRLRKGPRHGSVRRQSPPAIRP